MAKVTVDMDRVVCEVDRKIFGHFCEHAFGNIYGGFYDPASAQADENGLRRDVTEALRQVRVPLLRYPGGNFVSNYHWEDGIGPKDQRKRLFEYAWLTEESNEFGTADFIRLCRETGAEPLICVNMGTGTVEEAMHWVEYCNGTGNTYYANLRREHGYEQPFGVKYWGLGNEMYGAWQMNHKSAEDYADAAFEFAKAMKWVDPSIELIACGYEQNADWNYTVVKKVGHLVDYLSAHHYAVDWGPFRVEDYMQTLYIPEYMQRLTDSTTGAIYCGMNDADHRIKIAWDEWNLFGWIFDGVNDDKSYTLQNAIVTALILNMFIRNSDRIGMANYSTFVNINGAISTHGDCLVKRPQFHVFDLFGNHTGSRCYRTDVEAQTAEVAIAQSEHLGRLKTTVNLNDPESDRPITCVISLLDCVATGDGDRLDLTLINKDPDKDMQVELELRGSEKLGAGRMWRISHEDVHAANTLENPENVTLQEVPAPEFLGGRLRLCLPKHSVSLLEFPRENPEQ